MSAARAGAVKTGAIRPVRMLVSQYLGCPLNRRARPARHADSSPAPGDGSGMHASRSRRLLLLSEAVTPPDAVRRAPSPSTAARRVHLTQNQLRLSAHPPDQGLSAAMVVVAAGRALPSMPEQLKPPAGTRLQIFERELQAKAKEVNGPYCTPLLSEIIYCRADLI